MRIGVIADDFTGATDAASFIVKNGLSAIQVSNIPVGDLNNDSDAIVVSLKSRSCPADEAIKSSLQACDWLIRQGCSHIYFKYCSTFDSTSKGNIGPVTKALMERLEVKSTVICPALPINGRTVYQGYLFVFDRLLSDSGMRNHPITPMTDSNLIRLMESQSACSAALLSLQDTRAGTDNCSRRLAEISASGTSFIVCDALDEEDLVTIGQSVVDHRLATGGSGLVGAIAKALKTQHPLSEKPEVKLPKKLALGVILSGSCSLVTNNQVAYYKNIAPSLKLDVARCISEKTYIDEVYNWVLNHSGQDLFPLVYATVVTQELKWIQAEFGLDSSESVEKLFHNLTKKLYRKGYRTIISAGGETSGAVTQALNIEQFRIGQEISSGVPWVTDLNNEVYLALKSGNFGQERFFKQAQEQLQ